MGCSAMLLSLPSYLSLEEHLMMASLDLARLNLSLIEEAGLKIGLLFCLRLLAGKTALSEIQEANSKEHGAFEFGIELVEVEIVGLEFGLGGISGLVFG